MATANEIVNNILNIWDGVNCKKGYFIKFRDGNTTNCSVDNLEYITMRETFQASPYSQRVDWDCDLDNKQIGFVLKNWSTFGEIFSI